MKDRIRTSLSVIYSPFFVVSIVFCPKFQDLSESILKFSFVYKFCKAL